LAPSRRAFATGRLGAFWREEVRYYAHAEGRKPLRTQARELAALAARYEYPPYQYVREALFLTSCEDDVMRFVPPVIVDEYIRAVNAGMPADLAVDKQRFALEMQAAGLPAVETLFRLTRAGEILDARGAPVPYAELVRRLAGRADRAFFLKPLASGQGKGARIAEVVDGELCCDGVALDAETFAPHLFDGNAHKNYLVQPRIEQHATLDAITPASVNTVRIDTVFIEHRLEHTAAMLRMSDGSASTDNVSRGGFLVAVDLRTGTLARDARQLGRIDRRIVTTHPQTGFRFEGARLPFWGELLDVVRRAAEELWPLRTIGWDVAITPGGPLLVEANHTHGAIVLQEAARGLAGTPLATVALERYRPRVARRVERHTPTVSAPVARAGSRPVAVP
jgi:hypothetical protein